MKVMKSGIYQKQFDELDILSESWKRFRESFQSILTIILLVYIPLNILLSQIVNYQVKFWVTILLEMFIGIIAGMAIAYAIKSMIDGKPVSTGAAISNALCRWPAAVGTTIMLQINLALLTLLLIIPGIVYYIYWVFVLQAIVLNDKYGNDALDYSKSIVKDRWWTVFGYSLIFGFLSFIGGVVIALPFLLLPENIVSSVVRDTLIDIYRSFFAVVATVFYINFEATKRNGETIHAAESPQVN